MYKKKCATRVKLLFCLLNLLLLLLLVCLLASLFFDVLVALGSSDLQVPIYLGREGQRDASFFHLLVCRLPIVVVVACLFFDVLVGLTSLDLQVPIYLGREGERDASFFYLLVCRLLCMLPQGKKRTPDRRFIKQVTCLHSMSRLWEVQWVWTKDVKGTVMFEENLKT